LGKWIVGIAPEREIPRFAGESFKEWFRKRAACNEGRPAVILWPDTFNNYFHPYVAKAAVEVLEDAGFQVKVPEADMCCGRPLYDYGLLGKAKKYLLRILDLMRPEIEAGTPFVILEPSCGAVFRDELVNLFPNDLNARRLHRQSFLLSEFLNKHAPGYPGKQLERKAIVHGHCHHRAVFGMTDELALLRRAGLDFKLLDSGCCGMAGAFGFEKGDHYEVSVKCGERVLLPAVRTAEQETLVITNGFSCHEQIFQQAKRPALHLAQVLQLVIRQGKVPPGKAPPSADVQHKDGDGHVRDGHHHRVRRWAIAGATAAAAGAGVVFWSRHRK
jgi:Fe-S oxidoreductase